MAAPMINMAKMGFSRSYINFNKYLRVCVCKTFQNKFVQRKFSLISAVNYVNVHKKVKNWRILNEKVNFSTFSVKKSARKTLPEENERDDNIKRPVSLMEFPDQVVWPSIIKSVKNVITSRLVVRLHFDSDFDLSSFLTGAKQAVIKVSKILCGGDAEMLRGLVTDDAIDEIRPNLSKMSLKQREHLAVTEDDIYFGFVYMVGVMIDDNLDPQRRFVEITACFHCVRLYDETSSSSASFNHLRPEKGRINVANYRFIREFTKGVNDDWIINRLNHFTPLAI